MAEQPIQAKTIIFVAIVLAAVVGVLNVLKVDDEHTTMTDREREVLAAGNSSEELDPNTLKKRVEDSIRMLMSESTADRVEASRTFAQLMADEEERARVLELEPQVVSGMESALSMGKADPLPEVRENCRSAWTNLHAPSPEVNELP